MTKVLDKNTKRVARKKIQKVLNKRETKGKLFEAAVVLNIVATEALHDAQWLCYLVL